MKIFSLETKKHLVGWSLLLGGMVVGSVMFIDMVSKFQIPSPQPPIICPLLQPYKESFGWPFRISGCYPDMTMVTVENIIFWILVSLIILSLIRHFRKKDSGVSAKVG